VGNVANLVMAGVLLVVSVVVIVALAMHVRIVLVVTLTATTTATATVTLTIVTSAVCKSHTGDGILLLVVLVLIPPLDQFLLGLLKSKRAHEPLSLTRDVDIGHVSRVVDSRLAMVVRRIVRMTLLTVALATAASWVILVVGLRRVVVTFVDLLIVASASPLTSPWRIVSTAVSLHLQHLMTRRFSHPKGFLGYISVHLCQLLFVASGLVNILESGDSLLVERAVVNATIVLDFVFLD